MMHRFRPFLFLLLLPALCLWLSACDEYCDQGTTSAMVLQLCMDDEKETPVALKSSEYAVAGIGTLADSTRITRYDSKGLLLLPLSNGSDTTCFTIHVKDSPDYELMVVATRSARLISDVCGCATVASIQTVDIKAVEDAAPETVYTIKRHVICDPEVRVLTFAENYQYVTNLKIFF
ncbi:MAG: hypothetical protein IJL64_03745 [Bacteroidales bacterium]|nr:hypothetical protein [Bacteroidales bacterium]